MSGLKNIVLVFETSGWCEELSKSYDQGRYRPKTKEEYEALKGYAKEELDLSAEIGESEGEIPEDTLLTDEAIEELRARAKIAGVKSYHNKAPEKIIEELKALEQG